MGAHTPGPWVVSNKGGMLNVSAPASGGALASLGIPKGEERFANARLIAAAPDLLAACETQQRTIDHLCAIVRQAAADLEHLSGGGTAEWAEASLRRLWDAWRKSENAHGVGPESIAKAVGK